VYISIIRRLALLAVAAFPISCERFASTTPTDEARLSAPADADAEYPPTCSELGPAACATPCSRNDAASCLHLAEGHLEGVGVARDPARALELMRRACDGGLGRACGYLAAAIGRQKLTESVELARRGCELGYGGACIDYVGGHVLEPRPLDWAAAAPWLKKGCESGHGHACLIWGDLQRAGIGTAQDDDGAKAAYRVACERGDDVACPLAEGKIVLPRAHAIIMPSPSLRDAADLRPQLDGLKGDYHPKVSVCTEPAGTVRIDAIEGAPRGLETLVRRGIERWRFSPTAEADTPICTMLELDYRLQ
jgi:hypothetical protein